MSDPWTAVGAVFAGIVLVGAAYKASVSLLGGARSAVHRHDIIEALPARLDRVESEFTVNGGGLREAVNRQDAGMAAILDWQEEHANEDTVRLASITEQAMLAAEAAAAAVAKTHELDAYTHRRMHDILNKLTAGLGWQPIFDTRMRKLEAFAEAAETERLARHAAESVTELPKEP